MKWLSILVHQIVLEISSSIPHLLNQSNRISMGSVPLNSLSILTKSIRYDQLARLKTNQSKGKRSLEILFGHTTFWNASMVLMKPSEAHEAHLGVKQKIWIRVFWSFYDNNHTKTDLLSACS